MSKIKLVKLSAEEMEPFGKIIKIQESEPIFQSEEMIYWGNIAESQQDISIGFLTVFPRERILTELEHHKESFELMTVLDGEALLPLSLDMEDITVFHLEKGDSLIINSGIWHYHPAAINGDSASIQIIFNKRTETDDLIYASLDKTLNF